MAETPRVVLEEQVVSHAESLFGILDDDEVHRFTESDPPESLDWLRTRLARLETRRSPDGSERWLNWIVRDAGGKMLGYVQATVEPDGVATLGVVIGRRFWAVATARRRCAPWWPCWSRIMALSCCARQSIRSMPGPQVCSRDWA